MSALPLRAAIQLRPRPQRFYVYVDESSQTGSRYMVLGAMVIESGLAEQLNDCLEAVRSARELDKEIKWGKVSRSMLSAYDDFVSAALTQLHKDRAAFYSLVIDTSQLDHGRFNAGDKEIGFSKFVYQLLMKCARLYHWGGANIDCFLDDRTTRQTLTELRSILNHGANKTLSGVRPFRRVEYRDSRVTNLIQVVDVLSGAVAYHWNGKHLTPEASPPRIWLANSIAQQVRLHDLARETRPGRDTFSIWKFAAQPMQRASRRA